MFGRCFHPVFLCKRQPYAVRSLAYKSHFNNAKRRGAWNHDVPNTRWQQARKSLYIHYVGHVSECLNFCQQFGPIQAAYNGNDPNKGQLFVEMKYADSVDQILQNCKHFPNEDNLPVQTRHLYYKGRSSAVNVRGQGHLSDTRLIQIKEQSNGDFGYLSNISSISSQMQALTEHQALSDYGVRVRYFIADSVEEFVQKVLPSANVQLFGSTVNGFGRFDCDLDMVLDFKKVQEKEEKKRPIHGGEMLFLTKMRLDDERLHSQSMLELVAAILRSAMPQCVNVQKVLKARVPIIKFLHGASHVECDVCLSNNSAIVMSKLLDKLSSLDRRVVPLVFTIRTWARVNQITFSHPGPWLSNFMLTLMIIFYLQTHPVPVLPPLKKLLKFSEDSDGNKVYSILRGPTATRFDSANEESLEDLLKGFFQFYGDFDSISHGISVLEAETLNKIDDLPLFIENPLETEMNCSKIVMEKHLALFKDSCKESLKKLETDGSPVGNGLLSILDENTDIENDLEPSVNIKVGHIFDGTMEETSDIHSSNTAIDDPKR